MKLGRAILGGILAELLLMVPVVLVALWAGVLGTDMRTNLPVSVAVTVVAGSFLMPLLLTQWVARSVTSRFVLHGAIVGFSAFAVYMIPMLLAGASQPPIYWLAHAMKILGGLTGGIAAAKRALCPQRIGASV